MTSIKTGLTSPSKLKRQNMKGQMNKKVKFEFKIMHWNILSQKRADNEFEKIIPEQYLKWGHRNLLIQEHIRNVDADIIGLCDIDIGPKFTFFQRSMKTNGYGCYSQHNKFVGLGIAIFYKHSRFVLDESKSG